MPGNFGFYADPAMTTRVSGPLIMTVESGSVASATVYFGSPVIGDECVAADDGPIVISAASNIVQLAAGAAAPASELVLGQTFAGGVGSALAICVSTIGPAGDVIVTSNQLVEWIDG